MPIIIFITFFKILIFPFKIVFYIIPKGIYCLVTGKPYETTEERKVNKKLDKLNKKYGDDEE
ncbi:MAG: hypothetical protein MJ213_04500 [Bacilli bacterium]|nr:hypothetical protein [Bacilli bacterium]